MSDNIYYQVGQADTPLPQDPEFLEYDAAEEDALLSSNESGAVVAIWERDRSTGHATTIRLVFEDTIWYP